MIANPEALAKLQAAVEEYCAATNGTGDGWFLGNWVLVGALTNIEDGSLSAYIKVYDGENQPTHVTLGLLEYLRIRVDQYVREQFSFESGDDDDD